MTSHHNSIQTSIIFENANNSTIPPHSPFFLIFSTYLLKSPSMWSIYTSLLSLIWSAINCLRAYEPKDPSNTIISNDENRQFPFPGTCTFLYPCNSELYFGFDFLFSLDRDSSDSSDEEYSSENIMSSSTFNSPNIDSTILWRLSVISELDFNPGLSNLYLSFSFLASFMLISTSEFVLSSVFLLLFIIFCFEISLFLILLSSIQN